MKINLNVPNGTMCIGVFINYKTENDKKTGNFTTTNALIDTANYSGVEISENGELKYVARCRKGKTKNDC